MHVMTWHGTILSISEDGALHHVRLADGVSYRPVMLALHPGPGDAHASLGEWLKHVEADQQTAVAVSGCGDAQLVKARQQGCVHLKRGDFYLCASAHTDDARWDRTKPGVWETFLCLAPCDLVDLEHLHAQDWAFENSRRRIRRGGIAVQDGFTLHIGKTVIQLQQSLPLKSSDRRSGSTGAGDRAAGDYVPPDSFIVPVDESRVDEIVTGARLAALEPDQIDLGGLPEDRHPPLVATYAEYQRAARARLVVGDAHSRFFSPPLCLRREDRDFFAGRYRTFRDKPPPVGPQSDQCIVSRETDKYVVLKRYAEGTIFDEDGVSVGRGYLFHLKSHPPSLAIRGGRLYGSFELLRNVPRVREPVVVFYNGSLANYYHWLIDAMLPLDIILQADTRPLTLLLPAMNDTAKGQANRDLMELLGFASLPTVSLADDIVAVDEVVWLQNGDIEQVPARCVQAFRDRALRATGGQGRRERRIFIRRSHAIRSIANAEAVEGFLTREGFTVVEPERLSVGEQARLFQEAAFVIGAHGAGLSNLIYCPAGAKVLEISPDCEFRPFFWLIAEKTGLTHGLLPTPTDDGSFNGRLHVDLGRLQRLYDMLSACD